MNPKIRLILQLTIVTIMAMLSPAVMADNQKFTVVIDAGHGGKDIGATDNGVMEKNINLKVARELESLIKKKMKNTNVVMTRTSDVFLTLQERADKANKAQGDVFISIHTNSVDKKNKNRKNIAGSSVYTLGLHKDENNLEVARRENSVIEYEQDYEQKYSGFDPQRDESYIIFEMAQKKNLSRSIQFAESIEKELVNAGRQNRGVHQAGFWVLWATSMPSVLVELDFICNPESASYLYSDKGAKELAEAIFKALQKYEATWQRTVADSKGGKSVIANVNNQYVEVEEETTTPTLKTTTAAKTRVRDNANNRNTPTSGATGTKTAGDYRTKTKVSKGDESKDEVIAVVPQEQNVTAQKEQPVAKAKEKKKTKSKEEKGTKIKDEQAARVKEEASEIALAGVSTKGRREHVVNPNSGRNKNANPNVRRRRSKQSKEISMRNSYDGANLAFVGSQSQGGVSPSNDLVAATQVKTKANTKEDKKREKEEQKRAKEEQKRAKEEQKKAAKQRKKDAHNAKVNKMVTVYKIQILESGDYLRQGNPRFCGLTPITAFKENELYKYYYGESTNLAEMETLLKEVKSKIPDAVIVSMKTIQK